MRGFQDPVFWIYKNNLSKPFFLRHTACNAARASFRVYRRPALASATPRMASVAEDLIAPVKSLTVEQPTRSERSGDTKCVFI